MPDKTNPNFYTIGMTKLSTKALARRQESTQTAVQEVKSKGRKRLDFDKYFVGRSYKLFRQGIRSKHTLVFYNKQLFYFCRSVELTTEEIVQKYAGYRMMGSKARPNIEGQLQLQQILENYVLKLQDRVNNGEIKATSCVAHMPPLKLFCEMNDILVNWKKISRLLPRSDLTADDEAYNREQIRKMLDYCDLRGRLIVLIMSSTGIRLEGLSGLRVGDLTPFYHESNPKKVKAFSVKVYRGTDSEYTTFGTPEAWNAFMQYKSLREQYAKRSQPRAPFFSSDLPRIHWLKRQGHQLSSH
jgi:hypothetical protein